MSLRYGKNSAKDTTASGNNRSQSTQYTPSDNNYNGNNNDKEGIVNHTGLMWFFLILFPPVGLVYLCTNKIQYSRRKKKILTGIFGFYTFILFCGMMSGFGSDDNNTSTAAYVQEETTTAPLPTAKSTTKSTKAVTEFTTTEPYVSIADVTQAPETEAATEPETEPETEKTTAEKTTAEKMVWIDDTGKKYHSKKSCSNMDAPYQVPLSEAERRGYTPCGRKGCW